MRLGNALLSLVCVAALTIQAVSLCCPFSFDGRQNTIVYALHALFAAYLLLRSGDILVEGGDGPTPNPSSTSSRSPRLHSRCLASLHSS